jgi:hypothetical protein
MSGFLSLRHAGQIVALLAIQFVVNSKFARSVTAPDLRRLCTGRADPAKSQGEAHEAEMNQDFGKRNQHSGSWGSERPMGL